MPVSRKRTAEASADAPVETTEAPAATKRPRATRRKAVDEAPDEAPISDPEPAKPAIEEPADDDAPKPLRSRRVSKARTTKSTAADATTEEAPAVELPPAATPRKPVARVLSEEPSDGEGEIPLRRVRPSTEAASEGGPTGRFSRFLRNKSAVTEDETPTPRRGGWSFSPDDKAPAAEGPEAGDDESKEEKSAPVEARGEANGASHGDEGDGDGEGGDGGPAMTGRLSRDEWRALSPQERRRIRMERRMRRPGFVPRDGMDPRPAPRPAFQPGHPAAAAHNGPPQGFGFSAEGGEEGMAGIDDPRQRINMNELKEKSLEDLLALATELNVENANTLPRIDLIHEILGRQAERVGFIFTVGTLDITHDGHGYLRYQKNHYLPGPDDVSIPPPLLRKFNLRKGDTVAALARRPGRKERFWGLVRIESINGESLEAHRSRILFENLTPLYPNERLRLETDSKDMTTRVLDLMTPIGKGQRGLIVAPPRTGKTVVLQRIAQAVERNHPEVHLIVLLIDERPEEVTEMERTVKGEVISSTFDEPAERHVAVAEMVIEKAKRLVESKRDVLILLDSITRLGRAYNMTVRSSGKLLTGGLDANALQRPKRFFGAARNIEEGGSLTILATALVDTGSAMDNIIFEEFKGTGNMEAHLDRELIDRRVFPAMDIHKSGTRREELLLPEKTLQRVWLLRKALNELTPVETMEFLTERLRKCTTNEEFLDTMNV